MAGRMTMAGKMEMAGDMTTTGTRVVKVTEQNSNGNWQWLFK